MWKKISHLEDLLKYEKDIEILFEKHGKIFSQHFLSLKANLISNNKLNIYFDSENCLLIALEETDLGYYKSLIQGYPILGLNEKNILNFEKYFVKIKKILKYSTIYFPLVYENDLLNSIELKNIELVKWSRTPNPIFNQSLSLEYIYEQLLNRYGSRTKRQKKKFEERLYTAKAEIKDVQKIVEKIEKKSWKRKYKQDMLSKENQFNYYINIIESGLAELKVAYDDKKPIAYRIDSKVKNILYTIKWSFDEDYKNYSPGFYLLTFDLFKDYENDEISTIDLYGGPDTLKDLIETDRIKRFDICITSDISIAQKIKEERQSFDLVIQKNYKARKSIKNSYLNNIFSTSLIKNEI